MKKVYMILAAALAAAMTLSCEKKEVLIEESANQEGITQTFTCVFPGADDPDSKVTLGTDGKIGWEVGDELFVHGKNGKNAVVVTLGDPGTTISADKKTATFTATISDPCTYSSTIFVAYPASAIKDNWSSNQYLYWSNRFKETNALLLSGYNDTQDGGTTIRFINLCASISFKVDGDFDQYVFKGNSGETVGYSTYTVRFNNNGGDKKRYYAYVSGESWCDNTADPLTSISVTGWTGADGSTVNRVFLPYGDGGSMSFAGGFTIQFYKAGALVKQVSTSKVVNLSADTSSDKYTAKCLDLGDITPYLKDYVAPSSHDATTPAITGATALDGSGSANCYIVNAGDDSNANKVFKFKAYKGKGTTKVGTINSVSVLWATYNTSTAPSATTELIAEVDYDKQEANDYYEICFKMPSALKAGNAVIAAKDAADNILWTWHIWMPSSEITSSDYGLSDAGQTFMDRNLGALAVAEASADSDVNSSSFGLFYAWGRKDPFPGLCNLSSSSLIATTGSFIMNGAVMSVADSYAAPMTMVATGADANYTWTTDTPTAGLWGSSKTMNDPCPPGYVVPEFKNGKGLWAGASGAGFEVNETHKWFKMGVSPNYIVFPIVGYIDGNLATAANVNRGSRVYVWSSTATSTEGLSYNLRVNSAATSSNEWQRQARAGSIRCVAE